MTDAAVPIVTFHRIWFGTRDIPDDYEKFWCAWQRQYPDCSFRTWTDDDIDRLDMSRHKIAEAQSFASKADIARYEIMYKHGGIYIDCDIMPWVWFDPAEVVTQLVVCNEDNSTDYCSIGFFASPPGNPIFREMLDDINGRTLNKATPNVETGPWLFGQYLKRHPHKRLPPRTFYPYGYTEPFSAINKRDLSATWGIHVWGSSWFSSLQHRDKALSLLKSGDVEEVINVFNRNRAKPDAEIAGFMKEIVRIRSSLVALQKMDIVRNDLVLEDAAPFELLKVLMYLLEKNPQAVIWQVGAADGILVDPIRAALVNFDPQCLLLEPNPYLYKKLCASYANNANALMLNFALGDKNENLMMHCINPDKAQQKDLPNWVNGLSSFYDDKNAIGGVSITQELTDEINLCVEKIEVDVLTVPDILQRSNGRSPDTLIIDAEGMDLAIIKSVISSGIRPMIIHFEYQCMSEDEVQDVFSLLGNDYIFIKFGNDYTVYEKSLLFAYAEKLFVLNGIPTIYKKFLGYVCQI